MSASLYRHYDQAGLDAQLNLRERWPEHPKHFERWAGESAKARATLTAKLDQAYGPTAGQTLDVFPVPGRPDAPLLAFIHGGYWKSLDKGDFSYLAPPFVEAGIAYASLNYDLAPTVSVETIVAQVGRGLRWLTENAASLGFDPARLVVSGHSAGGHLAAMALAGGGTDPLPLKGVCPVSGVYELEPLRLSYHQEELSLGAEEVARISPLRLTPAAGVPVICAVGSEETQEFIDQQGELAAAWTAAGCDLRQVPLPGRDHFTAVDALGERDHPLFQAVRDLCLA